VEREKGWREERRRKEKREKNMKRGKGHEDIRSSQEYLKFLPPGNTTYSVSTPGAAGLARAGRGLKSNIRRSRVAHDVKNPRHRVDSLARKTTFSKSRLTTCWLAGWLAFACFLAHLKDHWILFFAHEVGVRSRIETRNKGRTIHYLTS
jgi:hypothetical protein